MSVQAGRYCSGPNLHTDFPRLYCMQNQFNAICMLTLIKDSVLFYIAVKQMKLYLPTGSWCCQYEQKLYMN